MKSRELFSVTWLPVLAASMCCLTPVVLVALGLSTVSFAIAVSDILYGQYDWVFQLAGLGLLAVSVISFLRRRRGICTLDDVRKRRNEVINVVALAFTVAVVAYIVWLFGIIEIIGYLLGIWR